MGTPKKRTADSRQVSVSKYAIKNIEDIVNYIAFVNQQPVNAVNVNKAIEATIAKNCFSSVSVQRMRSVDYQNKKISPGNLSVMAYYL